MRYDDGSGEIRGAKDCNLRDIVTGSPNSPVRGCFLVNAEARARLGERVVELRAVRVGGCALFDVHCTLENGDVVTLRRCMA